MSTDLCDSWINPRLKLAALWTSTLFLFAYVDLFSLYRADVRADLEQGKMAGFKVDQGFLLAVTGYITLPSLMVALSLLLPARITRVANITVAVAYLLSVVASAFEPSIYFVAASAVEVVLLSTVAIIAWRWPREEAAAKG